MAKKNKPLIFALLINPKNLVTMSSAIETGHAKNVANFSSLISFCTTYPAYNPSAAELTITGLNSKHTAARTALNNVIASLTAYNNAVNTRKTTFAALYPLATRVINALVASGAGAETIKDARTINRKLQGKEPQKKKPPLQATPSLPHSRATTSSSFTFQNSSASPHQSRLMHPTKLILISQR